MQSPGKGYLDIGLNISKESIYIVVNDDWDNWKRINIAEPLELAQGRQKVTIIAEGFRDASFQVDISAGETIKKNIGMANIYTDGSGSSYQWIKNGINYSIVTDDDSEIFVDGKWIALGSFEVHIPLGKHKIETIHPSGAKKEKELSINSNIFTKLEMYNKLLKRKAFLLSLTPGGSQFYKGQYLKGAAFLGGIITGLSLTFIYQISYNESNIDYEEIKDSYHNSNRYTSDEEILLRAEKAEELYDKAKHDAKLRDIFLYSTIGLYAINIIDALFSTPQAGYRNDFDKTENGLGINVNKNTLVINYRITF